MKTKRVKMRRKEHVERMIERERKGEREREGKREGERNGGKRERMQPKGRGALRNKRCL